MTEGPHAPGAAGVADASTEMRTVEFRGAGGPDVIHMASTTTPSPRAGQVLIEVVAFAVNRGDCLQRGGIYFPPPGESLIPGLEVSGRVVAVGHGVKTPIVGDEVCALVGSGAYAEYCVAESALCFPRPASLSLVEAASVPEALFTAYDNIFTRGRLMKGETLLIHGGSSGVGSTAIQLAKQFGAKVITTSGSQDKCNFCTQLGADHSINYREKDFVEEVGRISEGRGVDVILDCVGGPYIAKNLSVLAVEGRLVQIYFMQGSVIEKFDYMSVMLKRLTVTGSTLRPRTLAQKSAVADELRMRVWPLYESGALVPTVDSIFNIEETRKAHELMESSTHLGKIVVVTGK